MKTMKKFAALLLVVVLMAAMLVVPANAAGTAMSDTGTITIEKAAVNAEYKLYRIFDLESTNGSDLNVFITNSKWSAFSSDSHFTVSDGYVTPAATFDAAAFAKLAANYAKANTIAADATVTATSREVVINNLQYGYYLVVSSRGTDITRVYSAGTLNNTSGLKVEEKNEGYPTIAKAVDKQTADFGEELAYTITIETASGSDKYTIVDAPSAGVVINDAKEPVVKNDSTELTKGTDYTVEHIDANGLTISLTDGYRVTLPDGDKITITYYAFLNNTAVVEGAGNKNTATLYFDDEDADNESNNTKDAESVVFTGKITFAKKITATETYLAGAKFILYYEEGTTKYYAKLDANNNLVAWTTTKTEATEMTTADANISVYGLDVGTYYLEETVTPDGYTGIKNAQLVTITKTESAGIVTAVSSELVTIYNAPGGMFPGTGGIGTTIFYCLGGMLVLAAVVFLVSKKRMIED